MKTLQNNFTTPEQSKRLLKLGVPADSADCVLENLDTAENNFQSEHYTRWIIEKRHVKEDIFCERNKGIFLPCWSVGRLIKILKVCVTNRNELNEIFDELEMCIDETAVLVQTFKEYSDVIDFSKL